MQCSQFLFPLDIHYHFKFDIFNREFFLYITIPLKDTNSKQNRNEDFPLSLVFTSNLLPVRFCQWVPTGN